MKKIITLSAIAFALILSSCGNTSTSNATTEAFDTLKLKSGEAYYQCEMHPEVISDKAGTCTKCEMDLEKKEKK